MLGLPLSFLQEDAQLNIQTNNLFQSCFNFQTVPTSNGCYLNHSFVSNQEEEGDFSNRSSCVLQNPDNASLGIPVTSNFQPPPYLYSTYVWQDMSIKGKKVLFWYIHSVLWIWAYYLNRKNGTEILLISLWCLANIELRLWWQRHRKLSKTGWAISHPAH